MKEDLKLKLIELEGFIKGSEGKKARYRVEGNPAFTNDIIKDCIVNGDLVTVILENETVTTSEVHNISITKYEDREDIFIYGEKCNRFNISY